MKILVLNCGSSSLKFQLINMDNEERIVKGNFERIGGQKSNIRLNVRGVKSIVYKIARNFEEAIKTVLDLLQDPEYNIIKNIDEITAVGHRIVHGGEYFFDSVLITDEVIEKIKECTTLAPLHNPAGIAGIEAMKKILPNKPMVVAFDTSFHQTLPEKAYIYNIPYEFYEKYKIRKYGFHGTSHKFISQRVAKIENRDIKELKIISCHLGQGASICAIDGGKSVDTSMGLTPLSGIPMATRSGDIDPSIITYLMKKENIDPDEFDNILNKRSGAWGISGVSEDYRDIEEAYNAEDKRSILALESQAYKVAQYIGQYIITLGGIDVLAFAGGVGERGIETRIRICKYLEFLGLKLDLEANNVKGEERLISTQDSKIKVYIIPTNEELMIAEDTKRVIENL